MSHHIVTVCVVCVLCAAHTPCSAHTDLSKPENRNSIGLNQRLDPSWETNYFIQDQNKKPSSGLSRIKRTLSTMSYSEKKALGRAEQKTIDGHSIANQEKQDVGDDNKSWEIQERLGLIETTTSNVKNDNQSNQARRSKRHTDDQHFVRKIFRDFGNGNSLTIDGFEKLLKKIGLSNLVGDGQSKSRDRPQKDQFNHNHHGEDDMANKCLKGKELLNGVAKNEIYTDARNDNTVAEWVFEKVCPILLYQLARDNDSDDYGCIKIPEFHNTNQYHAEDDSKNMVQVWMYSMLSILVISLCGLLGVVVIPVMGKSYYNQLLQFLVALAVGSLCGDALIHLLPHALTSTHHHGPGHIPSPEDHEAEHNSNMWKGLVAMIGLVSFFFIEKALTMISERRKQRQRQNKLPPRVRVMRESDGSNSNDTGEKLCKHKYSSYPYCYGEITTETQDNHHHRPPHHEKQAQVIEEEKPLTSNCNSVSKIMSNDLDKKPNDDWSDSIINNSKKINDIPETLPLKEVESYTVIIREHENKHHGHTHSHGHVHSAPESMSNVAWMVIMGDGLHNFTDGMAIGAAFSASIAGGFSTAIAVLCHELPHELGDFAVLLKAGMSAKQAVFYNLLSSVLCLFGMIFGVLLGSTPTATSWMFAAAAGMFIYIALVDMIPELSSNHPTESGWQWQCILQALGLCMGLGIMLLIALYEHDLKQIFDN